MTDEPKNAESADTTSTGTDATSAAATEADTEGSKASKKSGRKKSASKKSSKTTTKKAASKKTSKKKTSKKKTTRKRTSKKSASVDEQDASGDERAAQSESSDERSEDRDDARREVEADGEADSGDGDDGDDGDESDGGDESGRGRKKSSRRSGRKTGGGSSSQASASKSSSSQSSSSGDSKPSKATTKTEMIVNYVPGEECRIAMLEDGQLEELMVEPTDKVSRVGNIYVGRIANIEPAIQAAFIDFGTEENGFLHISDLHPQYFASGDEQTERVGKKTPRRSRPPIQECLKRGQEIIVQVLKEGVGTKGPTLTSYLSIPGRFLVMMPGMDKVGVSRKEEDDDKRKAAKQILSQLELPDGFGFILRTAGFDRTKAELKRDLAYLNRLWKDMEGRRKKGKKPRLLYTESDLLVRSIRDLLTSEVGRVVIDSEPALKRVARFIKIAAPRSGAKLSRYTGTRPIFHAFGIESQINAIHAREVELPSGGRLVLDQTEALVAIDVNSGRSRGARDAETNAFKTNLEAVDAICRQLRLRDMGGLVVCDLIDMRHASHRKQIEQRFNERLKRDRAKSTTAPISPFGLMEMTRQRMRGSIESQHFAECPMCHGRGLIKRPDSVAATAIRDLAALLDHEKVHRAELVVNPRVASSLLSTKRASLTRIELLCGKTLEVRVSESLPIDRVAFYAYDGGGADIAIEKLKSPRGPDPEPHIVEWRDESSPDGSWAKDPLEEVDETTVQKLAAEIARKAEQAEHVELPVESLDDEDDQDGQGKKKRRRRRRRGGKGRGDGEGEDQQGEDREDRKPDRRSDEKTRTEEEDEKKSESGEDSSETSEQSEDGDEQPRKRRRRRRRGGRGRGRGEGSGEGESRDERSEESGGDEPEGEGEGERAESKPRPRRAGEDREDREERGDRDEGEPEGGRKRRRPRRRPQGGGRARQDSEEAKGSDSDRIAEPKPEPKAESKPRSRRGSRKQDQASEQPEAPKPEENGTTGARRRGLYSNARRTLSASELAKLGIE